MHLQPSEGKPRNVARPVIDMLFPKSVPCRIPIVAITGTNGKTTTARMVAYILKTQGRHVGLTTSTGLVSGNGGESYRLGESLNMAPGLGLIAGVIIDQHFAERGRMGRLLGAVAQNPRILGIGIDEDTAIIVENEQTFRVMGSGAIYVVDGRHITCSNISEGAQEKTLSLYDVCLHVLSHGDGFDLAARRPLGECGASQNGEAENAKNAD
jgi:cyanophycinase-like exopeptidase